MTIAPANATGYVNPYAPNDERYAYEARIRRSRIGYAPDSDVYDEAEKTLIGDILSHLSTAEIVALNELEWRQLRADTIARLAQAEHDSEAHQAARVHAINSARPAADVDAYLAQVAWDVAVEDPAVGVQDLADLWCQVRITRGVVSAMVQMVQPPTEINVGIYKTGLETFAQALESAIVRRTDAAVAVAHRAASAAAEATVAGQSKVKAK